MATVSFVTELCSAAPGLSVHSTMDPSARCSWNIPPQVLRALWILRGKGQRQVSTRLDVYLPHDPVMRGSCLCSRESPCRWLGDIEDRDAVGNLEVNGGRGHLAFIVHAHFVLLSRPPFDSGGETMM